MKGIIYIAKNKINNKVYVGQTRQSFKRRKAQHILSSQKENDKYYFHKAIRKYGDNNFEWEILNEIECDELKKLQSVLNELESEYIQKYKSNDYNFGYNMTSGGESYTEQASNFWNDSDRSDVWRAELSKRLSKHWADKKNREDHRNWMYDYYETEAGIEQAKRHSDYMKEHYNGDNGRKNKSTRANFFIKAISPDGKSMIFISSKEPNEYFGKDIYLRSRLHKVGETWTPTSKSWLFGWSFIAIPKDENIFEK